MRSNDGFVSTDAGVRLFFHAIGDGEQTVLVPNGLHLVDDFEHLAGDRRLVFYDVRGRGRSDAITDANLLAGGIVNDADDMDAVRRHFDVDRVDVIGHSYLGLGVVLMAMRFPDRVGRVVQIGSIQPDQATTYPPELRHIDGTSQAVMTAIAGLQREWASIDPIEHCRRFWTALRPLYVTDPKDADRIRWDRCELPNERGFMAIWLGHILPSLQRLQLTPNALAAVRTPVLTIHGKKDRSAPFGGGRDWALRLPDARLLVIENGGHAPWIEDPDGVFGAVATFLSGSWPAAASVAADL